ncbi:hypothetical protein PR202_ga20687 [Eleusine coracana subsp. coracana]|uniref:DUF7771 domain-containing protein n=1 Tax=Eleusine coracana subsp. coracana TaxID=191504 RepID=A0AAV5CZE2_ELECO|nr:hypothetical protein QOZ80_8AG0626970 [Eleusine coracana subsp. coracana]GJN03262.1 hypothetical protein PR202_ga20687 [Eleusine coracana subsp. coracana]
MDNTSQAAGLNRWLRVAAITIAFAAIRGPFPAHAAFRRAPPAPLEPRSNSKELNNTAKDCFITDPNGRKWPCSHINNPKYFDVGSGQIDKKYPLYTSVFDPAPRGITWDWDGERMIPNVTCQWQCAGNTMDGVVVWDERWPEAWSCRKDVGDRHCKLMSESNREVVLVTRAGRRVLGDLAIKDCSKNLWGLGGWLPFGLGCTYPKHDHKYYGTIA